MRPIEYSAEALSKLLRKQKIATMPELMAALGTDARRTVFRKLRELDYRTSYSHRGCYYTLDRVAEFDEFGLWSRAGVWFSVHGTLLATAAALAFLRCFPSDNRLGARGEADAVTLAFVGVAAQTIPGRDSVAPPQLKRDAPVLDVLHPVVVGLFPLLRDDLGVTGAHRIEGGRGQGLGGDPPLHRQCRLDAGVATLAMTDR